MTRAPAATFVLGMHRDYACGRSGVCCSSGWSIPVEPAADAAIRSGLDSGQLRLEHTDAPHSGLDGLLVPTTGLPDGAQATLGRHDGRCRFLEVAGGRLCAVHRQLGPEALPVACRQFPRLAVLEPAGAHVSLSHYCPTAAAMLFREDAHVAIERLSGDAMGGPLEGLECREALPPLLRPDALLSWKSHRQWADHALATLARRDLTPEGALRRLQADAEEARRWRTGEDLDSLIARLARREAGDPDPEAGWNAGRARGFVRAAQNAAVHPLEKLGSLSDAGADARLLAPGWAARGAVVARYLAARSHASWIAQQGRGLRSRVSALWMALAVLREQAARLCGRAERPLDDALLLEAIRASDLLLIHLADPQRLADACSVCEDD